MGRRERLRDTDKSLVTARGKGNGRGGGGYKGDRMMDGDLTWGNEHTIQYTD